MQTAPTTGRIVLFHPATDIGFGCVETPFAAIVAYVNVDGTINLSAFDHAGNSFGQQNVPLIQDGEDVPTDGSAYAHWMPYQIKAAEAAANAAGSKVAPKA